MSRSRSRSSRSVALRSMLSACGKHCWANRLAVSGDTSPKGFSFSRRWWASSSTSQQSMKCLRHRGWASREAIATRQHPKTEQFSVSVVIQTLEGQRCFLQCKLMVRERLSLVRKKKGVVLLPESHPPTPVLPTNFINSGDRPQWYEFSSTIQASRG